MNKHVDFPLTCKIIEETGVRDFTNEVENGITCMYVCMYIYIYVHIYIGKAGLEDPITFHEAECEITGGYYFNSGRNNKNNNVIKNLYDLRLKLKDDTNPAEVVIKLLMNSMHGKTNFKPVEADTIKQT